jgi:predicted RNA binding protein YcfA (HicA-like mRNA interferase family)
MSKLKKLIRQFLERPPEVRFEDVRYLLTAFGFIEVRSKGSHHSFRNAEGKIITVPKKGGQKVKGVYVQLIVKLINLNPSNEDSEVEDDENQDQSPENNE